MFEESGSSGSNRSSEICKGSETALAADVDEAHKTEAVGQSPNAIKWRRLMKNMRNRAQ